MPVGCLGVSSRAQAESSLYLDTMAASQDQQQQQEEQEPRQLLARSLLIQVARLPSAAAGPELRCEVCGPGARCCQADSGWAVMADLVRANTEAVWNQALVRAVNNLHYQGWVCPGYLVAGAAAEHVTALEAAWAGHALVPPASFTIVAVGVARGCSFAPFKQSPSPSLQDALCVVLSRLKMAATVANMDNIVARLHADYGNIPAPKDFIQLIHKTLGALIKSRKVYFTGKGYFLAVPDTGPGGASPGPAPAWRDEYKHFIPRPAAGGGGGADSAPCPPPETNGAHGGGPASASSPAARLSPAADTAADTSLASTGSESSPSAHLERSQSFKLSKKVQKSFAKGGSLRLSKKESVNFKEENDNSKNEEAEEDSENESPKRMERKGSVLGRIFGRKKSSQSPKKEILTFSAQFPPPDLVESMKVSGRLQLSSTETQTPPPVKRKPSLPARPALATPEEVRQRLGGPAPAAVGGVRSHQGASGNFVMVERGPSSSPAPAPAPLRQSPLSPNLGRPLPVSPGQQEQYGITGHIYSQVAPQLAAKPPPPAYSHAPPYRAAGPPLPATPTQPRPQQQRTPGSVSKQVHWAAPPRAQDRHSPRGPGSRASPGSRSAGGSSDGGSTAGSSSVSGPSSIESAGQLAGAGLYDDTLAVIERSNQELEQRLGGARHHAADKPEKRTFRAVDTIHNNRHVMDPEVIFEESSAASDLSRSSSVSTLKPDYPQLPPGPGPGAALPDHPSLADMGSIADLSGKFQSLTARKLMAGLSISSIDTLLEVNTAHDNHHKLSILNESTETIDFGVI